MINELLTVYLSGLAIMSATDFQPGKPAMSMPRPIKGSPESDALVKSELKRFELEKLKRMVISLGGKPYQAEIIQIAGHEFKINPMFLASLAFVESSFRTGVESNKGARGVMQVRPLVLEVFGVTEPYDPYQNIMAGAAYLKHCFERYEQYKDATYYALAAYNIGPGSIQKLQESEAAERFVRKVLRVYNYHSCDPIYVRKFKRQIDAHKKLDFRASIDFGNSKMPDRLNTLRRSP
jgi:hypothetical protein